MSSSPPSLRNQFLLDPERVHLNHGSFGAIPKVVMASLQRWQMTIESNPGKFMFRERDAALLKSKSALANYVGTSHENLVFVDNATFGMNVVGQGLDLKAGDEILTTNHEYGAVNRLLLKMSRNTGAAIKVVKMPEPMTTSEAFVAAFMAEANEKTKLITLSHITAPTGLLFPVSEVCAAARARGILTLIDGAHAPGMIPLDLDTLGADFYTGNCHKWICAPRPAAFLYASPTVQTTLEPFVVSWGYESSEPSGSTFQDYFGWTGTKDPAPLLAIEDAIKFQQEVITQEHLDGGHALVLAGLADLQHLFGQPNLAEPMERWTTRMGPAQLPPGIDGAEWYARLSSEFNIESMIREWEGRWCLRLSIHVYNDRSDVDRLLSALDQMMKGH